jgi:putative tryptophan/tyrosine transport system substrate-binding protein
MSKVTTSRFSSEGHHWTCFLAGYKCIVLILCFSISALTSESAVARRTQGPARVGILWIQNADEAAPYLGAVKDGLRELGWFEGQNIVFIERYNQGDESRFPKLAAELVALDVDVLFVNDSAVPTARAATSTIPIVCADFYDPVATKVTASLARPEGNVTGMSWQSVESGVKRLQLTMELLPRARRIGLLYNVGFAGAMMEGEGLFAAARKMHIALIGVEVRAPADLPAAFAKIRSERFDALLVSVDPLTFDAREQIGALAISLRLPMVAEMGEFADVGAVLTYGADILHTYRRSAYFVHRILNGAKPADLPYEQPSRFQLVLNQNTAKALGIRVPQSILENATKIVQ